MAESLDDGEFWLPPEFLTDDDLAVEKYETDTHEASKGGLLSFEFPYMGFGSFGTSSDLSSPVESVVGSSETESDEEDFLVGLSRQMARSTLTDPAFSSDKSKVYWEKKKHFLCFTIHVTLFIFLGFLIWVSFYCRLGLCPVHHNRPYVGAGRARATEVRTALLRSRTQRRLGICFTLQQGKWLGWERVKRCRVSTMAEEEVYLVLHQGNSNPLQSLFQSRTTPTQTLDFFLANHFLTSSCKYSFISILSWRLLAF